MKSNRIFRLAFLAAGIVLAGSLFAQNNKAALTVNVNEPTVELSDNLYGLFFEDINFGADGGLYAELVQNRSFEYYAVRGEMNDEGYKLNPMTAWEKVYRDGANADIIVTEYGALNDVNKNNLEIYCHNNTGFAGVANTGYDGIPVLQGEMYNFSIYAKKEVRDQWRYKGHKLLVQLEDGSGNVLASAEFDALTPEWSKFSAVLTPSASAKDGRLVILAHGRSRVQIDMVSLFPQNTYKGRENGLRKDLVEALIELQPAFLRFPGGCILHGWGYDNIYDWKESLGDVAERTPNWNRWGYHQTYGLGYFEYFQLCDDMGMEALPVVPVGVSCGFTEFDFVDMDHMAHEVQNALDLVEFANGSTDTKYGKIRAEMGHPESFNIKYVCLGNEEHDTPEFKERFPLFVKAFKEKYPEIKLIGTSGLSPNIPLYDMMDELDVYSSDEHYYMRPEWYLDNQNRFDNWDRSKPKVFVGEYASLGNKLYNAVCEAVYLTGIERNGDIVDMTCYAPLFARYGHTQWTRADLIWFDNEQVVRTPNYYVQKFFSLNKGDVYLSNKQSNWPGKELGVSVTYDKKSGEVLLKVANASEKGLSLDVNLEGAKGVAGKSMTTLLSGDKGDENTQDNPENLVPVTKKVKTGKAFTLDVPGMSVQVVRVKAKMK